MVSSHIVILHIQINMNMATTILLDVGVLLDHGDTEGVVVLIVVAREDTLGMLDTTEDSLDGVVRGDIDW